MTPNKIRRAISSVLPLAAAAFLSLFASSCITTSLELGSEYLASDQQFDIFTATFPLEDIRMAPADSLSGYSQTRITVGAIRDKDFGLVKRSAAVTLVPIYDTLDFGVSPEVNYFSMVIVKDTISTPDDANAYIHQPIKIYELTEPLESQFDINSEIKHGDELITQGIPVFNGTDEKLLVYFTKEFGEKYLQITLDDTRDITSYTKRFPGIYLETDEPRGEGGRINMFKVQLQYESSTRIINGNYALLNITSTYDGARKDTSFMFYFCPDQMYDVDSLVYNATGNLPQYCFNVAKHESADKGGPAGDKILVEGGGGLKPVLSATEIRNKVIAEISKHGDPSQAAINRASLDLPFIFPENYLDMDKYPEVLSPTCRIRTDDGTISFASITDSSDSSEDQGDVNRSLLKYAPDITYHTQALLRLNDLSKISNYDVWLLIMHNEIQTTTTSEKEQDEMTDYYNMMMYSSYYNGMYGGYGGYGYGGYGYGGYGYGNSYYNNYYSYYLMQQMYGSSSSTSSTVKTLDIYRYYNAILRGPADPVAHPTMTITYALPKTAQ